MFGIAFRTNLPIARSGFDGDGTPREPLTCEVPRLRSHSLLVNVHSRAVPAVKCRARCSRGTRQKVRRKQWRI